MNQQRSTKMLFSSCEAEAGFTRSLGPLSESMAIDSANFKRSPPLKHVYCALSRAHIIVDCGFTLSVQERRGQYHTLQTV